MPTTVAGPGAAPKGRKEIEVCEAVVIQGSYSRWEPALDAEGKPVVENTGMGPQGPVFTPVRNHVRYDVGEHIQGLPVTELVENHVVRADEEQEGRLAAEAAKAPKALPKGYNRAKVSVSATRTTPAAGPGPEIDAM